MKSLLAISGGWDSTYLLWRLLQQGDEVTAFHLNLTNVSDYYASLAQVEILAVAQIQAWFSGNGLSFELLNIDVDTVVRGEWMNPQAIRTAAALVGDYDRFCYGACPEFGTTGLRLAWYANLWQELTGGKPMCWPLREWNQCRPHAMFSLPAELQSLIVSCIKPNVCKGCHKCRANIAMRTLLDSGRSPDDALDWLIKQRRTDAKYRQVLAPGLRQDA